MQEQSVTVTDVNEEDIDTLWEKVRYNLSLALDRSQGEYSLSDIHSGLLSGNMRLWIGYDENGILLSCAVCELVEYPQKTVCYVLLAGGGFFDIWVEASQSIEEWARENGADAISAYTRRGVAKKMKDYEYRESYTVITKDLTTRRLH